MSLLDRSVGLAISGRNAAANNVVQRFETSGGYFTLSKALELRTDMQGHKNPLPTQ